MKLKLSLVIGIFVMAMAIITSCQDEAQLNYKRYYSTGSTVYQTHCQNCHGAKGEGLGALIPPLTDTAYLRANMQNLPCIIKNGLTGNVTIHGKTYSQAMPAVELTSIQVAEVLTYVGNSFGNKMGLVDVEVVDRDLAGCK